MCKENSIFWDINNSLSRNCLFNFIVGNRGGGKTYGSKKFVIKRFLKTGAQFVYIRRYKEELKKIGQFFEDIKDAFPEVEFEVKGRKFYIDKQEAGVALPLSTSKIEKSTAYPKVETIIFDEFILDKGYYHYLPDEVTNFLECYETIARMRDNVRVFFLSNALSVTNPYFLYFKIQLPTRKDNIRVDGDILVELVSKEEFIKEKENTRFGKLIKGTKYGDYAISNSFLRDDNSFIEKKSGNCIYSFGYSYKDKKYGVWVNVKEGKIYVSYDIDKNFPYMYALTKSDHNPNTLLIDSLRRSRPFQMFIKNFQMANVYFEDMNIKNMTYEMLAMAQITK